MKENEAPEKIYFAPYGDMRENHPITDNDIEYTRTDVFIDKACEWFRTLDDKEPPYKTKEEFIEGFKKAMAI